MLTKLSIYTTMKYNRKCGRLVQTYGDYRMSTGNFPLGHSSPWQGRKVSHPYPRERSLGRFFSHPRHQVGIYPRGESVPVTKCNI